MALLGYDNFNGADSSALTAHTPDSGGGTWTAANGSTDTGVLTGTGGAYGANSWYYNSQAPGSADYFVIGIIKTGSAGDTSPGPIARQASGADTHYHVLFDGTSWVLRKRVAGVQTDLGTYTGDAPTTAKTVRLTVTGTTQRVLIDGNVRISTSDTDITAAGFGGIYLLGSSSSKYADYWSLNSLTQSNGPHSISLRICIGS